MPIAVTRATSNSGKFIHGHVTSINTIILHSIHSRSGFRPNENPCTLGFTNQFNRHSRAFARPHWLVSHSFFLDVLVTIAATGPNSVTPSVSSGGRQVNRWPPHAEQHVPEAGRSPSGFARPAL
jgi:hypothetical protein